MDIRSILINTYMLNDYSTFYFIFLVFQIIQQDQIRQVMLYKMKKKIHTYITQGI